MDDDTAAGRQATLSAALARLVPAGAGPGAVAAGAVEYVARRLAGDPEGAMVSAGLDLLELRARERHGSSFGGLAALRQDELLHELAAESGPAGAGAVRRLVLLALEGSFCHPARGGNREGAGWRFAGLDTGGLDTAVLENGGLETAGLENGGLDTGGLDTAVLDTGGLDTTGLENGGLDNGGLDTTGLDTGGLDNAGPSSGFRAPDPSVSRPSVRCRAPFDGRRLAIDGPPPVAAGSRLVTDILIVGSGAGGGPLALVLARAGFDVVVLEKGPRFSREGFRSQDELDLRAGLYFPPLAEDPHTVVTPLTREPVRTINELSNARACRYSSLTGPGSDPSRAAVRDVSAAALSNRSGPLRPWSAAKTSLEISLCTAIRSSEAT